MKRANCPSCGAPVVFRAATSIYVVCEFCRSTLLRAGEDLRNLGRMADLLEDTSLLQLGSEGVFRRQPFSVIGRIQLKYEAGLWNEWHILFADGRTAWLAEANATVRLIEDVSPDGTAGRGHPVGGHGQRRRRRPCRGPARRTC